MTLAHFNIDEILEVLKPIKYQLNTKNLIDRKFITDSRIIEEGQWFIALKGINHDGHNYIEELCKKNVEGIILDNPNFITSKIKNYILVPNTLDAYHILANYWLNKVNPITIAITGSSGKTTTKEICYQTIKTFNINVHATQKNENNEYGVPKTIFNMPKTTQYLVLELAMRGLKQIEYLANTVKPNYGIITNAGTAHIELLGSKQNIIKAKCELFAVMNNSNNTKLAVIGENNIDLINYAQKIYKNKIKIFKDNCLEIIESNFATTKFKVDNFIYSMASYGAATLADAWCVIQVLQDIGITQDEINSGLSNYKSIDGRGSRYENSKGLLIIDESYNANPESVKSAINNLLDSKVYNKKNKLIILGHMAELGDTTESSHAELGKWLSNQNFTHLLTLGEIANIINKNCTKDEITNLNFKSWNNLYEYLISQNLSSDSAVLVKGSRVAQLDQLVNALTKI